MGGLDVRVTEALDELVRPRSAPDGWDAIVAAADPPARARRRLLLRAVPVASIAVAAVIVALAWPFGAGPRGTILERAAAAVGDGPVVHAVIRSGWGGTVVDLEDGSRRRIDAEQEVWYDPARGIHEITRFDGILQGEAVYPPGKVSYLDKTLGGLATGYADALRDGTARVLGKDIVEGIPVYWIRVDTQFLPDVADGRLHEWAHDVAVSQETFEPVATRETRDGNLSPDGISLVLEVETLPEGEGSFTRVSREPVFESVHMHFDDVSLTPAGASDVLGRRALWLGPRFAGLDLEGISTERIDRYDPGTQTSEPLSVAVVFHYGTPGERSLSVAVSADPAFRRGVKGYTPPAGSILVLDGPSGFMRKDGLHVRFSPSSSEELLLAAARALEPVPGG